MANQRPELKKLLHNYVRKRSVSQITMNTQSELAARAWSDSSTILSAVYRRIDRLTTVRAQYGSRAEREGRN